MEQAIRLLSERNEYLERFTRLNQKEIARMTKGDFDHVDMFYKNREELLGLVQLAERRLDVLLRNNDNELPVDENTRELAREHLILRDNLVATILDQDLEIISMIEGAKSRIIKELRTLQKNKKIVGAYHSGTRNHALDEEV